jgi:hypothetical protein
MKKIKFLVLAFLLAFSYAAPAFAIDDPDYANVIKLRGTGGRAGDSTRLIKLVRNSNAGPSTASISSRDAVIYDTTSDDAVSVTLTTTSADGAFAGIACTSIQSSDATSGTSVYDDEGRRNWGWIVVHGKADAKVTAGGTNGAAAKQVFITSSDSGAITGPNASDAVASGKVYSASGGFFFDTADTTSSAVEVFVENT